MGIIARSISRCSIRGEHILIFVCVGSRGYQFNRLLVAVDKLVGNGELVDRVFAQIGSSSYLPQHYEYRRYLSADEFRQYQMEADLIITHGGTGAIIGALKLGKQVIAFPRLARYGEHTDDHQLQVSTVLAEAGYLKCVVDENDLLPTILQLKKEPIQLKYSRESMVQETIMRFIQKQVCGLRT